MGLNWRKRQNKNYLPIICFVVLCAANDPGKKNHKNIQIQNLNKCKELNKFYCGLNNTQYL